MCFSPKMSQDYDISANIIPNRDIKDVDVVTPHDTDEGELQQSRTDEGDGNQNAVDHSEVTESSGNRNEQPNICKQEVSVGDDSKDNEGEKKDQVPAVSLQHDGSAKDAKETTPEPVVTPPDTVATPSAAQPAVGQKIQDDTTVSSVTPAVPPADKTAEVPPAKTPVASHSETAMDTEPSVDTTEKKPTVSSESTHVLPKTDTKPAEVVSEPVPMETEPVAGVTAVPGETVVQDTAVAGMSSSASTPTESKGPIQSVYHVKWIKFNNEVVPIVTQNENGPCPLLAIMNVILLQGRVKFPPMIEMVTSDQLLEYLADCIFEHAPKNITEDARLNYEQNMHDAMAVFHKLQTGLDVNVKFTGVADFEYTPECIVFDLLSIPLYHGWLVDPESPEVVAAVGQCSYNQLVEKIIVQKNSNREELTTEALIAEEFLERTAAQLTYHGLSELSTSVKAGELTVFFRNNHFSTLYKHKNELLTLVTDQGFLTESNMVWETLCNVEGDGHFVDAEFRTYTKPEPSTEPIAASPVQIGSESQINQDYLVALTLQEESTVESCQPTNVQWQQSGGGGGGGGGGGQPSLSDHELAMQLQEEENQRAAAAAAQAQAQAPPATQTNSSSSQGRRSLPRQQQPPQQREQRDRKKSSDCIII